MRQEGTISTLSGKHLKLIDQFTYRGSNISSTESDVKYTSWEGVDCDGQFVDYMADY